MDLGSRNNIRVEGGMSSMTDLVFLLLIFFIIMSTLAQPMYDVELPNSNNVSEALKDGYIDIVIRKDDTYFIDGSDRPNISFEEMEKLILSQQKELIDKGGVKQARLRISADKDSKFGMFSDVMTLAKLNDLKVSIVTE